PGGGEGGPRLGALGGARGLVRARLVEPDRAQLEVVAVLSDAQLALGAGTHHALLGAVIPRLSAFGAVYTSGGIGERRLRVLSNRGEANARRYRIRRRSRPRLQGHLSEGTGASADHPEAPYRIAGSARA